MRSFKRKRVHHLTTLVKAKSTSRSKGLLKRHAIHGLESFLLSDQKLLPLRRQITFKMIISSHPQFHLSLKNFDMSAAYKSPLSHGLAGISSIGRTPLIFVPAGVKSTPKPDNHVFNFRFTNQMDLNCNPSQLQDTHGIILG